MAFSGGVFSRIYDWTDDRDAAVAITASRFDTEMDGMATGLSTCLLKDGTQTVTANIPFAGFRLTGIGLATARTDAARADQLQDGLLQFATATGTDTYAATLAPVITAYANGQSFRIKFTNANTTAATLNVNTVGAVALEKRNGTALVSGDIPANSIFEVTYNSTGPKFIIDREVVAAQPLDTDLTTIAAITVVRGSIMRGSSAPAWEALALGSAGQGHFSDGTDLVNSKVKALHLSQEAVSGLVLVNGKIVASVAANALTIEIKTLAGANPSAADPVWIVLPDETIATGAPDFVTLTAAASLVIPNTATMGATNAIAFKLWVLGFNSGAAFAEIGAVNCLSGTDIMALEEGALYSPTAVSTGADSAQVIYTTSGQTNKPFRVLGYLEWPSGLAAVGVWDAAPTTVRQAMIGMKLPGDIVQSVFGEYSTYASGATTIPADDTIPQNTEGNETVTKAITVRGASNILAVESTWSFLGVGANEHAAGALFRDSTADAKAVHNMSCSTGGAPLSGSIVFRELAGAIGSTTYKLRCGSATVTVYFNGTDTVRRYGGKAAHRMSIQELMA